jgi:hypothetical protein
MKKIILICGAIVLSLGSFVQTNPTINRMKKDTTTIDKNNIKTDQTIRNQPVGALYTNYVTMKDGKMMTMQYGKLTVMKSDISLNNGTKIMSDGTLISKDGTKTIIKEGDYIDISGN